MCVKKWGNFTDCVDKSAWICYNISILNEKKRSEMKHYFIINPASGKGKSQIALEQQIKSVCDELGAEYEIYHTTAIGDAERFVRETAAAGGTNRFYACGGDGTICEVVNGAAAFAGAEVGVIPVGTGNDFVRNFTSSDKFFDIAAQINGSTQRLDLIKYNDRYMANMINIGFDCEVVRRVVSIKKNPLIPGKLAYIAGVVKTLIKKPGVSITVSVDGGEPCKKDLLLTCIANGEFCGGGFHSAPLSALNNGKMDVCFINNITRRQFISLVPSYKAGTYLGRKDVADFAEYITCSRIDIEFSGLQYISVDGELEQYERLSLISLPGALRFCMPEGCELKKPVPPVQSTED